MAVIRKRLIFWLIKAYIKKSGKTLMICFVAGLILFAGFAVASRYFSQITIPFSQKQTIGLVGAYTQDNLPREVVSNLSSGLTQLDDDGSIKPNLAESWETLDNGKTYVFKLRKGQYFNNGKELTSENVSYRFSDVTVERPDDYTIVYKLKDAYAPFLVTVSRPVFDTGYVGVGDYRIEKVDLNGNFVQSLTLVSTKSRHDTITYEFYPSEEALKMAFLLGEVNEAKGLVTNNYHESSFLNFPNTTVKEDANYSRLVTLFFNTTDSTLSDKRIRIALSYAIPDVFPGGQRAYLPYSPESTYYNNDIPQKKLDYEHAKELMQPAAEASGSAQSSAPQELTIKTLKKYKPTADVIAAGWKNIGINTIVEEVDAIPDQYQIFLGDFNLPRDPDQYTIWHSDQRNNITRYKNLRIDKLLEDGRKTNNPEERIQLYKDFQRYLMEDAPAAFLYFPTEYAVVRK
jgi:peptide/nickel transport system substrate-binding protein